MATFKKLWKAEVSLTERKASTHSKCSICANIAIQFQKLSGNNTKDAQDRRRALQNARDVHEANHLGERTEMDYACLRSIVEPQGIWTIMADAATQKNFELPRVYKNRTKDLQNVPWFGLKCMATYAPGYGFTPFLVHDSMYAGANLLWTVVWLTLGNMQAHFGYLPAELHLQLDNTSGENKNETMVVMAAWLVQMGYFKRVRVFFLMVGHTHVIIDQIFGVITKSIKARQLLEVRQLVECIEGTLLANPQYCGKPVQLPQAMWDFKSFCKATLGGVKSLTYLTGNPLYFDEQGGWGGYRDFLFDEKGMRMRQSTQAPYLDAVVVLSVAPPANAWPKLAANKLPDAWRKKGGKDVRTTIVSALNHAAVSDTDLITLARRWDLVLDSVPTSHERLLAANPAPFPQLPRNGPTFTSAVRIGDQDEELITLARDFGVCILDRMMNPSVMPMVTSNQSATQLKAALERERLLLRGSCKPTSSGQSSIFPGDFLIVQTQAGAELQLVHATKLEGAVGPNDLAAKFYANVYEQTRNEDHPDGLFGTFKEAHVATAQSRARTSQSKVSVRLDRAHVVLYNVRPIGTGCKRRLNLSTLKLVAATDPRPEYEVPMQLPDSHARDGSITSDEDDDSAGPTLPPPPPPTRRRVPNQQRSGSPNAVNTASSGSSDDSSDEDEDVAGTKSDSTPTTPESSAGEESEEDDDEGEADADGEPDTAEERARLDEWAGFACNLTDGSLVFINLKGQADLDEKTYPVELAHISDVTTGTDDDGQTSVSGTVGWYGRTFTTKGFPTSKSATFGKYLIDKEWYVEKNFVLTHCVLPIAVPSGRCPNKSPPSVSLAPTFMAKVAKECDKYGVINSGK